MKIKFQIISKITSKITQINRNLIAKINERKVRLRRRVEYRRLIRIRKHKIPQYTHCKNCGAELHGMYCSQCGQYALDTNQNFIRYIQQFFENTYQFDGKILVTLKYLILKPGFLSLEFLKGKIRSYVHPLKLYMFISLLFFAFLSFVVSQSRKSNQLFNDFMIESLASDSARQNKTNIGYSIKINNELQESINNNDSVASRIQPLKRGENPLSQFKQLSKNDRKFFIKEFSNSMFTYLPLIIFLLMPLFGVMLRNSYKKSKPKYMPNFVFSLHLHSFALIIIAVLILLSNYLDINIGKYLNILFILYYIYASKVFYQLKWKSTVFKSLISLTIYSIIVILTTAMLSVYVLFSLGQSFNINYIY